MIATADKIIHGPPLMASPNIRDALKTHVRPFTREPEEGDLVGLGAHYRLFTDVTSTIGAILPVYPLWVWGEAGFMALGGQKATNFESMKNGRPVMDSLRPDLSTQISYTLAFLASSDIQSFDLICTTEGVLILRRAQTTHSTDILAIKDLDLVGALPWSFCSNHRQMAFRHYLSTHLMKT